MKLFLILFEFLIMLRARGLRESFRTALQNDVRVATHTEAVSPRDSRDGVSWLLETSGEACRLSKFTSLTLRECPTAMKG